MVFQILKFGQKSPEEEYKEQAKAEFESRRSMQESVKSEEKVQTAEQFLKSPEAQRFIEDWKKKGYTKRGVVKLLLVLYPFTKGKKGGVLTAAKDLLASLKGEDGLSRLLGVLKLVPEGIMK